MKIKHAREIWKINFHKTFWQQFKFALIPEKISNAGTLLKFFPLANSVAVTVSQNLEHNVNIDIHL